MRTILTPLIGRICDRVYKLESIESTTIDQPAQHADENRQPTESDANKMESNAVNRFDAMPTPRRFLLLASYLTRWICEDFFNACSYNPPKFDRRFFVKHNAEQRRRTVAVLHPTGVESADSLHNRGPAAVPIDRLVQAMRALTTANGGGLMPAELLRMLTELNVLVQVAMDNFVCILQLSTLVKAGFVAQTSNGANLNEPKFRCMLELDAALELGKSLGVDVTEYLIDFVQR